jgi:flagellar biosynthetic protein FliQ
MTSGDLITIMRDSLWVLFKIAAPLVGTSLAIGLIVSLFQALTQVQEMTLTFVPKVLAIGFIFMMLSPYISHTLEDYTHQLFNHIVGKEPS